MDYKLKVFHVVVTERSFSKAADLLFMSQSNVSYIIKKLEKDLNITLIERKHNAISLTSAGERLLVFTEKYLQDWNELLNDFRWFRDNSDMPLNVGTVYLVSDYVIRKFIQPMRDQASHSRIVNMIVGNSKEVMIALRTRRVDFAFVSEPISEVDCIAEPFLQDEIVLVVNRDHPWRQVQSITLDMLTSMPCIAREEGSATQRIIESRLANEGLDPKKLDVAFIGGNYSTVLQAVENGLGYGLVPLSAIHEQLEHQVLFTIPIQGVSFHRSFLFVTLRNSLRIPEHKRAFNFMLQLIDN